MASEAQLPRIPRPGNVGLRTADGRQLDLQLSDARIGRDLLDILKPGEVIHGRVAERFADGSYLFTLRGRNLIASSEVPLLRDSVVRFQVLDTADGLRLRIDHAPPSDRAATSDAAARLQRLGLPDNAIGRLVLQAFEQQQAPLADPTRLGRAAAAVSQAQPAQQTLMAAAQALLASNQLPATPALLSLAERALQPELPQPATRVGHLLQRLEVPLPAAPSAMVEGLPTRTADGLSATSQAPSTAPAPPSLPSMPASQAASPPLPGKPAAVNPGQFPQQATTAALELISPLRQAIAQAVQVLQPSTNQVVSTPSLPAAPPPAATTPPAPIPAGEQLVQELQQQNASRRELAELIQHLHRAGPEQMPAPLLDLGHLAMREQLADLVFRPAGLEDYDLVLPLLLHNPERQAMPARLAVAHRHSTSGGDLTFVRVDVELQRLGPVSIRLGGGEQGPINITLLATGAGLDRLQADVADLKHDLTELGYDARIRIADLTESGQEADHAR
jgi:hypothetical protein